MASFPRSTATRLTLALTLAFGAGGPAQAQFFFQPFGGVYRYDPPPPPPDDDERPRYATPRAVSRILARRGFQLVSGLGRRGDQVVATGVSRRDGAMRFFIDPYEGEIIHAVRLAPPGGDASEEERMERPRGADQPRPPEREALRRPPRAAPAGDPVARTPAPTTPAPPQPAKPKEAVRSAEPAKPTEPARPDAVKPDAPKTEAAKPEIIKVEAPKPEPKVEAAKPADPPPVADRAAKDPKSAEAKTPEKSAETPRGAPGRRAIVAPKAREGGAAMAQPTATPNATP